MYKRQAFNDQAHIVYVNSQIKDETALGKLMHDFFCTNSKDMNYSILAQRVRYFKEDTKGVAAMCRAMEKMRDETEHEKMCIRDRPDAIPPIIPLELFEDVQEKIAKNKKDRKSVV